jgi:hypothetical protein
MPMSSGSSAPSSTRATTSLSRRRGADGDAPVVVSHPPADRTRDRGVRENRARNVPAVLLRGLEWT